MFDTDTKRRIDSCRDIMVGEAPDPKSQVKQALVAANRELIARFGKKSRLRSPASGAKNRRPPGKISAHDPS